MPSYLSGVLCFIIGCFVPKRAHASIGQNAHFTICKSVAFIAMAVIFMSEKFAYL